MTQSFMIGIAGVVYVAVVNFIPYLYKVSSLDSLIFLHAKIVYNRIHASTLRSISSLPFAAARTHST